MAKRIKSDASYLIHSVCTTYRPLVSVELGCCNGLTEDLDSSVLSNITYDNRPSLIRKVKDAVDIENTNFVVYSDILSLCKEIFSSVIPDLALVGGPLADRGFFAQEMIDKDVPVIILLDFEEAFKCGYTSLRHHSYWNRVFYDPYGGKIKVLVNNPLNRVFVNGYK